jgi:hypothetical protein
MIKRNILHFIKEYFMAIVLGMVAGDCVGILMYFWPTSITLSLSLEILKAILTIDGILIAFFGVSFSRLNEKLEHLIGGDFALAFCITELTFVSSMLFALITMGALSELIVVPKFNFLLTFVGMFAGLAQQVYLAASYVKLLVGKKITFTK